jgi:translocation and assembly module TamB
MVCLICLTGLLVTIFVFINLPFSHRYLAGKVNVILANAGVPVHINSVNRIFPGSVSIDGALITGHKGDTIIYAGRLKSDFKTFKLLEKKLILPSLKLENTRISFSRNIGDEQLNIAAAFSGGPQPLPDEGKGEKKPWEVSIEKAEITDLDFRMNDPVAGIFIREDVRKIQAEIRRMSLVERTIIPAYINIEGSIGSIILNQQPSELESKSGPFWILGLGEINVRDINFVFEDTVKKLKLDLLAGEIKIEATGTDFSRNLIVFRQISILKTSATIQTENSSDDLEKKATDKPAGFPWNIRGHDLVLRDVSLCLLDHSVPGEKNPLTCLNINGAAMELSDIRADSLMVNADLRKLEFTLGNGFSIKKMKGRISSDQAVTKMDLEMRTGFSSLKIRGGADGNIFNILKNPSAIQRADLELDRSVIDLEDLVYFKPDIKEKYIERILPSNSFDVKADLQLDGPILKLSDFAVSLFSIANLKIKGDVRNAFAPERTILDLGWAISDVSNIGIEKLIRGLNQGIPVPSFSNFSAEGVLTDSLMSPHATLNITSDLGNIAFSGSVNFSDDIFSARSSFEHLHLDRILNNPVPGIFCGTGEIKGSGLIKKSLNADASLNIDSVNFKGYTYKRAKIECMIREKRYDLHVDINDPCFIFDLTAGLDLSAPELSLKAKAGFLADLYKIHLSGDTIVVKGNLNGDLKKHDSLVYGNAELSDINIRTPEDEENIKNIKVSLHSDSVSTELVSSSDFFSAEAHANRQVQDIGKFFPEYLKYIGDLVDPRKSKVPMQLPLIPEISCSLNLRYSSVFKIFAPDTTFGFNDITILVNSDTTRNLIRYGVRGDRIKYKNIEVGRLNALLTDSVSTIDLKVIADTCMISQQLLNKVRIDSHFSDWESTSNVAAIDRNDSVVYFFEINTVMDSNNVYFKIPSGYITLNGRKWQLESPDIMQVNTDEENFTPSLKIYRNDSHIFLFKDDMKEWQTLKLELEKVKLSDIFRTEILPGKPDGTISGAAEYAKNNAMISKVTGDLKMSDVSWSDLKYRKILMAGSFLSDSFGIFSVDVSASLDSAEVRIKGERRQGMERDINAKVDRIPVNTIEPFVSKYLSDLKGTISGEISLKSKAETRMMTGEFLMTNGNLRINALNSSYRLPEERISFSDKKMLFNNFRVIDSQGNELFVKGSIDYGDKKMATADLNISSSNLQVMNLKEERNSVFYGDIFINSSLSITGPVSGPVLRGNIALAKGTDIYFRQMEDLSFSETENIITFTSSNIEEQESWTSTLNDLGIYNKTSVASIVKIDPSTRINIEILRRMFNINLGVVGGGEINYNMLINGQVNMTGRYGIEEGEANLKMVGWPNKAFRLTKGGFIRWDGKLDDPELHLEAVNRVKSSYLNPVDNKERYVDFDVVLKISKRLSDMGVVFTISTSDQYLMSIINTMSPEEQMRQAITILLFESIDLPGISTSSDYVSEQVNQMVAAQLNSLTKTTIKGIDISFGLDTYTQGTASGGEQTKTSLSYEVRKNLLNDRAKIEFSGIVSDVNQSKNANTSLNNFSFEYRIDSAATKFLKVYNEHSYEDVFEGDVVKTGIGFTYSRNYPSLGDIWRRKGKNGKSKNP